MHWDIAGNRKQAQGRVEERCGIGASYGISRDEAERQLVARKARWLEEAI